MIIDRTGREIRAGQILDVSALTLTGPMLPVKVIEVYEPAGLELPTGTQPTPPYVGVMVTLQMLVRQIPNKLSRDKVYLCDNTYVIQEPEQEPELGPDGITKNIAPNGTKPGLTRIK